MLKKTLNNFLQKGAVLQKGTVIVACCFITSAYSSACSNRFQTNLAVEENITTQRRFASQIKTLKDLAQEITQGLLITQGQEALWQIYQNTFFANPENTEETITDALKIVTQYPNLSKLVFRDQFLSFPSKTYIFPKKLKDFVRNYTLASSSKKVAFIQVENNILYWSKVFQMDRALNSQERLSLLINKLESRLINQLKTNEINQDLIIELYKKLKKERDKQILNSQSTKFISTAMLDLVHSMGFLNPQVLDKLKNQDPEIVIEGFKQGLKYRDDLSKALHFKGFSELKNSLNLGNLNKDFYDSDQLLLQIEAFRKEMNHVLGHAKNLIKTYRLRALSLIESSFRGCLGNDCSSRSYFNVALSPNFIYWTTTNKDFHSSGQITTVLGTAINSKKEEVKVAFIDKIQNFSAIDLIPILSSIQNSLKEEGYLLAFPLTIGDTNGLSNSKEIRTHAKEKILPQLLSPSKPNGILKGFSPHDHDYTFNDIHLSMSRADDKLDLVEWNWDLSDNIKITPGEKYSTYTLKKLTPEYFIENLLNLKDSKDITDIRSFVKNIEALNQVDSKKYSKKRLADMLQDLLKKQSSSNYKLKKEILYKLSDLNFEIFLDSFFTFFNLQERSQMKGEISNWAKSLKKERRDAFRALSLVYKLNIKDMIGWDKVFKNTNPKISNDDIQFIVTKRYLSLIKFLHEKNNLYLINRRFKNENNILTLVADRSDTDQAYMELLYYLVEVARLPINYQNDDGDTALILAVDNNNLKAVQYFKSVGADESIQNKLEQDALTVATDSNYKEIEKYLQQF